ncbi:hypothetical protein PCE1_004807 [Barthelona sp. PCE]
MIHDLELLETYGCVLSPEHKAALRLSLPILRDSYHLVDVKFWGKISGLYKDYFIVEGKTKNSEKQAFYSHNCMDWVMMPQFSEVNAQNAKMIDVPFRGDPSYIYPGPKPEPEPKPEKEEGEEEEEEEEEEDEDKPNPNDVTEAVRLAYVFSLISYDNDIVPRGALIKDLVSDIVRQNPTYNGLPLEKCKDLGYYFHNREKTSTASSAQTQLDAAVEFMDSLVLDDALTSSWNLNYDSVRNCIYIVNLKWPGFVFSNVVNSSVYLGCYFGDGLANRDLAFMI